MAVKGAAPSRKRVVSVKKKGVHRGKHKPEKKKKSGLI